MSTRRPRGAEPRRSATCWPVAALGFVLACETGGPSEPTPTGALCPTPDPMTLTYDNFGRKFMSDYCTWCHDSSLPRSQRNGAPIYHDFDTLLGVLQVVDHVDQRTGAGPNAHNTLMPGARCPSTKGGVLDRACPQPTDQERTDLSVWLACEQQRTH
jgi:hypothetical protein